MGDSRCFRQAVLIRLATDEFEHMRLIETWQDEGQPRLRIEASVIERLVPKLSDKSLQIRGTTGQHQLSALSAALDLEKSARTFYEEQSRLMKEESARALFSRLAEMEAAHYALIQAEIDSIQLNGFWFGLPSSRSNRNDKSGRPSGRPCYYQRNVLRKPDLPLLALDAQPCQLGQHRLIDLRHDRNLYAGQLQLSVHNHADADGRRQADCPRHC